MTLPKSFVLLLAAAAGARSLPAQDAKDATETAMIRSIDAGTPASITLLEQLVNINSGTMNLPGVVAVKDVLQPRFEALGFKVVWHPMADVDQRAGDLVATHPCRAADNKCGKRILAIGHMDTVFEPASSFQKYSIVPGTHGNVATGPGVNDMKGGLVVLLAALDAMKASGALDHAAITVVLSGDEERHGTPTEVARKDMIEAAKHSDLAMEFESGGIVDGKDAASISRRSAETWSLITTGKTGHSSGIFNSAMGYGAIYEMARILDEFRIKLPEQGLTYNVGLIAGGSTAAMNANDTGATATGKSNVIAPTSLAYGDLRCFSEDQAARVRKKMQEIVAAHLPQTSANLTFADGYPAMAPTPAGHALVKELNAVNATLGLPAEQEMDPMLRGAGDIAFVAPYVPGLVGTGAMGNGAHAEGETVFLDSIPRQAKRTALLMYRLSREPAGPVQP